MGVFSEVAPCYEFGNLANLGSLSPHMTATFLMRSLLLSTMLILTSGLAASVAHGQATADPTIPFQKFVLDNGLTVVVSEDHRLPLVNVRVWYHVGAQEETVGQRTFAHLFEHVMFGRTQHMEQPISDVLAEIGVVLYDASTSFDITSYFETVPVEALDAVLWMESERMGYPLLTQETIDREREIVFNEDRMRSSQPGRQISSATFAEAYPTDHPYHWVGSASEDLREATLEDFRAWHRDYYGAANATLVVAGDVNADSVRQKVEHYFGEIPPGPPVPKLKAWVARRYETRRRQVYADVSDPLVRLAWNVPGWGAPAADYLTLAAPLLADGPTSVLWERLVVEEKLATSVTAGLDAMELGGLFLIDVTLRPEADMERVETIVREEVARLAREEPNTEALERIRMQHRLASLQDRQHLGRWWDGRSTLLMQGEVFHHDPGHYRTIDERIQTATPDEVRQAVKEWLTEGALVLRVLPPPRFAASDRRADRSRRPASGPAPVVSLPEPHRDTLANGLDIFVIPRPGTGLVNVSLVLDAGFASEATPGTVQLMLALLERGATGPSGEEVAAKLAAHGAEIHTRASLDATGVSMNVLTGQLAPALSLFADVVRQPDFTAQALEEERARQLAQIRAEETDPIQLALRLLPPVLYGNAHPYGRSHTGRGTAATVPQISLDDLVRHHRQHVHPASATLLVVGDVTADAALPLVREAFEDWSARTAPAATSSPPSASPAPERAVYLVDHPGAERSAVFAAQAVPEAARAAPAALEMVRYVLGGFRGAVPRLVANLRTEKGWAYWAFILENVAPLIAYTPVQTDKTAEAMQEIVKEWQAMTNERPVTEEELRLAKKNQKLQLVSDLETLEATSQRWSDHLAAESPETSFADLPTAIDQLTPKAVTRAAREVLRPDQLVWLVVGDRAQIEDEIRSLGFGPLIVVDPSNPTLP